MGMLLRRRNQEPAKAPEADKKHKAAAKPKADKKTAEK